MIEGIHHATVLVSNLERALAFYVGVLGLRVDPSRPESDFRGAWLNVGGQQIHLMELPEPAPRDGRPEHAGRDRHIALMVEDFAQLCDVLDAAAVACTRSRSGRQALFCRDPDGNGLEFVGKGG